MTPQEKSKEAKKRYKRIAAKYKLLRKNQPLATKNAIMSFIAAEEGVTTATVSRSINYCRG